MKRRSVLRSISMGAIGAIAGCLNQGVGGIRVPEIQVYNSTNKNQTLKIKVQYNGDLAYGEQYRIPEQDGPVVHGPVIEDLPDTPGRWVVEATAMGFEKRNHIKININKHSEGDCTIPVVGIREKPSRRLTVTTLDECDFATYSG